MRHLLDRYIPLVTHILGEFWEHMEGVMPFFGKVSCGVLTGQRASILQFLVD